MAKKTDDEFFTYEADEIMDVIAALPQKEKKIILYRLNPQGNSAYVEDFFPEEFSQAVIKERYGGGKYLIHADTSDGMKKMRFTIEGESKIAGAQRTVRMVRNGKTYLVSLSEKEIIEKAVKGEPIFDEGSLEGTLYHGKVIPNGNESTSLLMMQIQRLEAKLESLQNANNGSGSRREFYEEMAILKNLFASNEPKTDQQQLTAMFTKGLEIAGQAFQGEVPSSNPWLSIIEKSIPVITQALTAAVANQARIVTAPGPSPVNDGSLNHRLPNGGIADILPGVVNNPPAPKNNLAPMLETIRPFLPNLMRSAAANQDPAPYAEIIAGQIPEMEKTNVLNWLSNGSYMSDLTAMEPAIALQASWWGDLQTALFEIINGQNEDNDDGKEIAN